MFTAKRQRRSNQLKNFLDRLFPVFIVFGDWLPRLTVMWFRRLTSHNNILLLCRYPMLALEFEPPTPRITKVRTRTHSALETTRVPSRSSGLPNTTGQRYKSRVGQPHIS
jgi:hypothetical protein